MNIALFGATGMIGSRILEEALKRGHTVTVVIRDLSRFPSGGPDITVKQGDVLDPSSVAAIDADHDVVISAIGPGSGDPKLVVEAAHSLAKARPKRLIVVGGAGGLEVAPGIQLADTPDFPAAWKSIADAHREALAVYRKADFDWTYISPAAFIGPGVRTGKYRTDTDKLITDKKGESKITAEDYAVAILDEVERPRFVRQRFTAAY